MVGRLPPDRYIFRGQPVCNRLRTSFHRTSRRDLNQFLSIDIPQLHAIVTSKTNHYFDLRDNIQNAAFWNLLQHHGYPTPLIAPNGLKISSSYILSLT
ncbi:FRG domain-containing protein [Phyllobacterium brassicacearum]